jgi:7-cyano-7-deazaguanine synthase
VPLSTVHISGLPATGAGYIRGRNALLLAVALAWNHQCPSLVALGAHAGTGYADCSLPFVESIQQIFDVYADGTVRVVAPFLGWTKADIWAFSTQRNVPIEITYSCEAGTDDPCGVCATCLDFKALRRW